jgi:hypothetical protein
MPLPQSPDLPDWPILCQILLQHSAHVELGLRKLLPNLTVLSGFVLFLYLLALATMDVMAWLIWRRQTRISRLLAKFQRIKTRITGKGQNDRLRLASARQRRNLKELASLVEKQLKTSKRNMHPSLYKRTSVFIEKSVTNLDFDRLYSLHHLLSQVDAQQVAPRLEVFFQQTR